MKYTKQLSPGQTPQSQPIPGKQMVKNPAGGYAFKITPLQRLVRFLTLGAENPTSVKLGQATHYESGEQLTRQHFDNIVSMLDAGEKVVETIVEVSTAIPSRVPKMDPSIFALAVCAAQKNHPEVRQEALRAIPVVCRIPTHLFMFIDAYKALGGGWGRATKRAVQNWYLEKGDKKLAYHLIKYQGRNGWTNKDVLRLCHAKPTNADQQALFNWTVNKDVPDTPSTEVQKYLVDANELLRGDASKKRAIHLIETHNFTHEMVPTNLLTDKDVWFTLLQKMPLTAMIRNLGRLSHLGLLNPLSEGEKIVNEALTKDRIHKSRVHPMTILVAHRQYRAGRGLRGNLFWVPNSRVLAALERGFYDAFDNVEPTNKRFFLGLDVSGSMHSGAVMGIHGFTPFEAVSALSLIPMKTEPYTFAGAFTTTFEPLNVSSADTLDTMHQKCRRMAFGGTDCAQPMLYALDKKIPVDTFMVLTDNETWFGEIHPSQALQKYRDRTGINAKLIVCAVTSTYRSIADPSDAGMLDVSGFDTTLPHIIREFTLA